MMSIIKDAVVHEKRTLKPTVLETKENLLTALRTGSIKTTKYNLLTEEEKLFVELVAFGEYSPETAVRTIHEDIGTYAATYARRMMAKKEVIDTLNELTEVKDKSFRASLARTRELALKKAEYIMLTSNDEKIQLDAAKLILDKAEGMTKIKDEKEGGVGGIRINIAVDKVSMEAAKTIIPIDDDAIEAEYESVGVVPPKSKKETVEELLDPDTGLPYTIRYEGINSYGEDGEDE